MKKRFIKTEMNTNDHRRKRLTKMTLRLVLSATTLSAILTGCGVSDNVTTEEVESDLIQVTTESEVAGEYSYLYDRLADTYGEFKVDVKEDGKTYTITIKVEDEEIFGYELTYNESTHIFTCNEDIILDEVELIDGNVEYITLKDSVTTISTDEEFKSADMNYGRRFKVEETDEVKELEDGETAYKVTYLDIKGTEVAENEVPTEEASTEKATTEETTTEVPTTTVPSNTPKPPSTTPSTSTPSADNGNSNVVTPTTEAPVVPSVPSTTETPSVPTTEEVKECQHNWVEVMNQQEVPDYDEHICKYCGFSTIGSVDNIIAHCGNCGGIWTHEELIALGLDPNSTAYQVSVNTYKGADYTTKTHYKYIDVPTGKYYCDICYRTKQ